jgi:hypothetical protein
LWPGTWRRRPVRRRRRPQRRGRRRRQVGGSWLGQRYRLRHGSRLRLDRAGSRLRERDRFPRMASSLHFFGHRSPSPSSQIGTPSWSEDSCRSRDAHAADAPISSTNQLAPMVVHAVSIVVHRDPRFLPNPAQKGTVSRTVDRLEWPSNAGGTPRARVRGGSAMFVESFAALFRVASPRCAAGCVEVRSHRFRCGEAGRGAIGMWP